MMVTVTLAGILMAMAVPSLRRLIDSNAVATSVNGLVGALAFARTEALKRGQPVVMCRSTDAETTDTPACANATAWEAGWIVFVDLDGDGRFDAGDGETLLRAQGPARTGTIRQNPGGTSFPGLVFRPTGMMTSAGVGRFEVLPVSGDTALARTVCIGLGGRTRLLAGTGGCN